MLKIIESESNAWTLIAEDGELHIYGREDGEWAELALSEDAEQVDPDKSALLEELYQRETSEDGHGGQEPRGEAGAEDEEAAEEDEGEEDEEEEPELDADEEGEEDEGEEDDEEPEPQAEKPRRRRAKSGGRR